jgi:SAM-dependent methyltransferase
MRADGRGIEAYDLPHRVAAYDADMALMHPNRADMVDAALDFLPLPAEAAPSAIDLGCGTGYFTARFLRRFPSGSVIAVDGAATMIDLARARLGPSAAAVQFFVGDFRDLAGLGLVGDVDAVFSSYALHHLSRREKQAVVSQAATLLRPGGWFLNADLVVAS